VDEPPSPAEPVFSKPSDFFLTWLLRAIGVLDLLSFAAIVIPHSLMVAIHAHLGIGALPSEPIVGYLARTASMFYGFTGVLLLYLATDVVKFREVIRFVAGCGIASGMIVLGVDFMEGLPTWWIALEGPSCALLAACVWWLAR
jgi:hypothetical protein